MHVYVNMWFNPYKEYGSSYQQRTTAPPRPAPPSPTVSYLASSQDKINCANMSTYRIHWVVHSNCMQRKHFLWIWSVRAMLVGSLAMKNRKGLAPDVFGTSVPPLALLVSLIRTQKGWLLMYLALLYHHWPCLCHWHRLLGTKQQHSCQSWSCFLDFQMPPPFFFLTKRTIHWAETAVCLFLRPYIYISHRGDL